MPDQIYKRVLLVFLIIIKSVKEKKKEITYLIAYIKNKKKQKNKPLLHLYLTLQYYRVKLGLIIDSLFLVNISVPNTLISYIKPRRYFMIHLGVEKLLYTSKCDKSNNSLIL